jgi:MerR family transcriptional regulator, light-induced transcriptional regulator
VRVEPVGRWYSMGELVREMGIPAATLRAWERRYGVPRPQRSSGRHRLYSERDLALIRWLMERQREGMGISRAIAVWKQMEARGATPEAPPALMVVESGGRPLEELCGSWTEACLQYDGRAAEAIVTQAFALYPQEEVCLHLLQRGVSRIGELWAEGKASVQQEHFASGLALHHLERLIAATPPAWRGQRLLIIAPPEEQHTIGLLVLNFLLRRRGWDVLFLGANVPIDQMDATVAATRPSLAVMAAYRLATAATLIEMSEALRRLGVEVAYGGSVFDGEPSLRARVRGRYLGPEIPGAPEAIETIVS